LMLLLLFCFVVWCVQLEVNNNLQCYLPLPLPLPLPLFLYYWRLDTLECVYVSALLFTYLFFLLLFHNDVVIPCTLLLTSHHVCIRYDAQSW
jgi:hypothetical protein